jgi:hypothetical protein
MTSKNPTYGTTEKPTYGTKENPTYGKINTGASSSTQKTRRIKGNNIEAQNALLLEKLEK